MDGRLVMLRHTGHDLPVALHEHEAFAKAAAEDRDWDLTEEERMIFSVDCDSPVDVCIVHFVDGKPVEVKTVRIWWDGEEAP